MNHRESYSGIDYFRFVAAFLIITIHTSPLSSGSETGDFILTRIISRTAVPFFFMTSGFFLISRYGCNTDKLMSFLKKTALLYGVSILIYIPLNIYNNYFKMNHLLPNLIKDILFDGTMYHLWYFPAAMIGALIAWLLVKRIGIGSALPVVVVLYVIGLLGDSYYGMTERIPLLKGVYDSFFELSDYTRNGIFFAPVFFVLGGMFAERSDRISGKISLFGIAVSFLLMLGEGMLLRTFRLQKHDSMYIFLIPCMYFLFHAISLWRGKRSKYLRTTALVIYIIHPMMIVIVRMIAKMISMQSLFVENSLVHFLLVSLLSAVFAAMVTSLIYKFQSGFVGSCLKHPSGVCKLLLAEKGRVFMEINYDNLKHNVTIIRKAMADDCELMAVVKADAYGHGALEVSAFLNRIGVKAFAAATIDEGIALRRYGIQGEILILGYTSPSRAKELHKYDLMQTLIDYDHARQLNEQRVAIRAHIKIDTGMHRLGFDSNDTEAVVKSFAMRYIRICGIYTHLCVSDSLAEEDVGFTGLQIERFYQLLDTLRTKSIKIPKTHMQSSYGLLNYPELKCSYVRAGIALYGVLSSPQDKTRLQLDLHTVLTLQSQIVLLRKVQEGESIGYGRAFVAEKDSLIAILPIGYADGVPRSLSCGKGGVLVHGQRAKILGRICMDQLAVDVTGIEHVSVGDRVTLIGKDGCEELTAAAVADASGSISNELLSRMGKRGR